MKKLPMEEIKDIPTRQVIEDLRARKYSLLESAGCHKLRSEMKWPGLVCRLVINWVWGTNGVDKKSFRHDRLVAAKLAKLLDWAAPSEITGTIPTRTHSLVIGFNHPSLGEIIRFIRICMSDHHNHSHLFPVNLPWYEALMPVVDKLERLGIYITPIITPSTYDKMQKIASSEDMIVVEELRKGFSMRYVELCTEFVKNHGVIWVAPSATRRPTVFRSKNEYDNLERAEPPTMTLIASSMVRAGIKDCEFLSCAVVPPQGATRGLNLFKEYELNFGECYDMNQVGWLIRQKCEHHRGRMFEYEFLQSICHSLKNMNAEHLFYP